MSRFALDHASADYKEARARLLAAEEALRDRAEAVAALRRALPADTPVPQDYAFTELAGGGRRTVTLSGLFGAQPTLILMHFMWAPADDEPCPMCAHAISLARIRRLYYGAAEPKGGGVEHGPMIFHSTSAHHALEIFGGVGERTAAELLRDFFRTLRS